MKSEFAQKPDGTIELAVTVPWATVESTLNGVIEDIVKRTELPGFRKGKAPRKVVEEKLDRNEAYEEVLKKLLPQLYNDAITEHKLRPIINPKIELVEAKEHSDWKVRMVTCERPKLTIGDFKKAVSELKSAKHKKIWVPGADKKEEPKEPTKPTLDEILTAVLSTITGIIPALLLENQINKMLSDLIDQTKKLGLSVEQYLTSTGKTADGVREEYKAQAENSLKLEFALEDIADKEGVIISDDDIDTVLKTAKTDEERKSLEKERYYLASLLRRQKTLDFLGGL